MKVLVINSGSSSIKYQLFEMGQGEKVLARGVVERIGINGALLKQFADGQDVFEEKTAILDHTMGIQRLLGALTGGTKPVLKSINEIEAVGHRVVHGGEQFHHSVVINENVKEQIRNCSDLAPLHNPSNLRGILSLEALLKQTPQVAVFDTSFHQSMPEEAFLYGLPLKFYKDYKIRRYGFHGISHEYVAKKGCRISHRDYKKSRIITCHLGNGSSITAVKNGKSIDTSMGFTPVTGLMMGTRCGTLDPGILLYLEEKHNLSIKGISNLINKESGLQGISGFSSDMRDIEKAAQEGVYRAQLALDMYVYRIKKWIGSFTGVMNGVDLLVFTGGIGENSFYVRKQICKSLSFFGIGIDDLANMEACGEDKIINPSDKEVTVAVVKTNEELVIARETYRLINR